MADIRVSQSFVTAASEASSDIRVTQTFVPAVTGAAPDVRVTVSYLLAIVQEPAEFVRNAQTRVEAITQATNEIHNLQTYVYAITKGRTTDPHLRAWTYSLDGHDYYVLRLGNDRTLVYDLSTTAWSVFGAEESELWQAYNGANWLGGSGFAGSFGSNVLVGDHARGTLYFLDPSRDFDDDSIAGPDTPREFLRKAYAQLTVRGTAKVPCFQVQLLGSMGDAVTSSVTLSYSDDRGNTFSSADPVEITTGDYEARVDWLSLGSFSAPGRLFRIEDYGALRRIDTFDMPPFDQE